MAIAATVQWDVRTTGSDTNGGGFDPTSGTPGTDYSQQSSPQVVFTDLVIGATTTQLTSAANPFSAAVVGNILNITSGTGFTVGWYQVMSVSGTTATMDRAVGTAASTGGNGNLGGSLATIRQANTNSASGNTINIKAGTYTVTAEIQVAQSTVSFIGYQTTHGDGGTSPLITTATNSVYLFNTLSSNAGVQLFQNLSLSNTAATRAGGIWQRTGHGTTQSWIFRQCTFDGFTSGIDNSDSIPFEVYSLYVFECEFKNCTVRAIDASSPNTFSYIDSCYIHDCPAGIYATSGSSPGFHASRCIIANISGKGIETNNKGAAIQSCTIFNCTQAIYIDGSAASVFINGNILYGNSYGVYVSTATVGSKSSAKASAYNAAGGNTIADYFNWAPDPTNISLTVNPFTSSGSGDYSLNSNAGGGTACKGAAYPGVFPGGTSTGALDIGAVQSATGGGGGGYSYTFIA